MCSFGDNFRFLVQLSLLISYTSHPVSQGDTIALYWIRWLLEILHTGLRWLLEILHTGLWLPYTKSHLYAGIYAKSFDDLVKSPVAPLGLILSIVIKIIRKNRNIHVLNYHHNHSQTLRMHIFCSERVDHVLTRLTTYALGDNPRNLHYALVHDNWLTSWISRPRARNPLGQPVIALGHKWIPGVIPSEHRWLTRS